MLPANAGQGFAASVDLQFMVRLMDTLFNHFDSACNVPWQCDPAVLAIFVNLGNTVLLLFLSCIYIYIYIDI